MTLLANTLLWEIEYKDSLRKTIKPSYLFGTVHATHEKILPFIEWVRPYISDCEVFANEYNFLEGYTDELYSEIVCLPNRQTIRDFLSKKQAARLENMLQATVGIDLKIVENKIPFVIVSLIEGAMVHKTENHKILDEALFQYALEKGKKIEGVETFVEQMNTLKSLPIHDQLKHLKKLCKNNYTHKKRIYKLFEYYFDQDIVSIYKAAKKYNSHIKKPLLNDRNPIMSKRIVEMIQKESSFIAIGAGHLAGKNGVLRLLKQEKCSIKPIFHK